uniref:PITH domain-containing protein n=1 Tax=Loa loa TaxID=7209 RepID=A0A1I7W0F7_LOALO
MYDKSFRFFRQGEPGKPGFPGVADIVVVLNLPKLGCVQCPAGPNGPRDPEDSQIKLAAQENSGLLECKVDMEYQDHLVYMVMSANQIIKVNLGLMDHQEEAVQNTFRYPVIKV